MSSILSKPNSYGHLTVICGPMFSGKTGLLIERILADRSKKLIFKPAMDVRFAEREIVGRAGGRVEAMPISRWPEIADDVATIYLDEVQFLEGGHFYDDLPDCVRRALQNGVDVVACGLDMDFAGYAFNVTAKLAAMADAVIKLTARCSTCGSTASKSIRCDASTDRVSLGDAGQYQAACNKCFGKRATAIARLS